MPQLGGTAVKRPKPKAKKAGRLQKEAKAIKIMPPAMKKKLGAKAFLAKSSGTTKGEVKGVMKELRSGAISKGSAIKTLRGGPKAGVPRSKANTKKVARAIRKAR
jgi:hypothetical protein